METLEKVPDEKVPFIGLRMIQLILELHQFHREQLAYQKIFEEACLELQRTMNQRESLDSVAQNLQMSFHRFRKWFKTMSGQSPKDYQLSKRMEAIQRDLIGTHHKVSTLVHRHGYPDVYALSKQFRKLVGMSPSEYQQQWS